MPPGSLVYTGEKIRPTIIKKISFNDNSLSEEIIDNLSDVNLSSKNNVNWIEVNGISDSEKINQICSKLKLHPLTIEDILNPNQRPKIEEFDKYIFIVLKSISYKNKEIGLDQMSFILGKNFIFSFSEEESFDIIKERIKTGHGIVRKHKNDYLLYALLDSIIDNYFLVLEELSEEMEDLEEEIILNKNFEVLNEIHLLKRKLILLRKSIWPLRYVIASLYKTKSSLVDDSTDIYLRDLYDHVIRLLDMIETYRDINSGMLEIYMSNISNKTNETMKVLTIIATIFIPLTFIVGVYGMNFEYMPELNWYYGYPLIMGIMFLISVAMLIYFRVKKWI